MYVPMKNLSIGMFSLILMLMNLTSFCIGQIIELREYNGKKISCIQSGLRGFSMPCGIDGQDTYVFVGSILSEMEVSDTEKRLQLRPEEVFRGLPVTVLTATTEQSVCLPEMRVGDRWLFYLAQKNQAGELILRYGGRSKPLADADEDVSTLRFLAGLTDSGIVKGTVTRRYIWDGEGTPFPVKHHTILAKRKSDGTEYRAATDVNGRYEFRQLPSGSYELSANDDEVWAESGTVRVHDGSCSYVDFAMRSAGRISGRIRAVDGKPFVTHPWVQVHLISGSDNNLASGYVDQDGFYEVSGLEPGRYLVGIGILNDGSPHWWPAVYYPGVPIRHQAVVVEIGQAEKRTGIDFQLPAKVGP